MSSFVRLLGAPAVKHGDDWLELPVGKTSALLFYLAYQGGWVSRDDLLYLFWPDTSEHHARQNLRPLLTKMRHLEYITGLEIEKTRLCWAVPSDVAAFRQARAEARWAEAWQHYQGDLLEPFKAHELPEFESWLALERSEVRRHWRQVALAFAAELEQTGRYKEAAEVLATLYRRDPLDEGVLRRYLVALSLKGGRSEALEVYGAFSCLLRDEVEGEPEAITQELIERIKLGEAPALSVARAVQASQEVRSLRAQPLPPRATPFIGRLQERARLAGELNDPACRLLTLVGPGGIGKTRLAIEVAREQTGFRDGALFVTFESVTSPEFMVPTLASALNFSFFGSQDPTQQLLDYLADQELLLVMDNLEHVLEGVKLIAQVLAAAPGVKVMATSRERLNLQAEWVFDLGGMSYPGATSSLAQRESPRPLEVGGLPGGDHQAYDAVQLFVQAAHRAKADVALSERNLPAVRRICQLVEGMPLALELAASWLRLLCVEEIVAQLESGIDLLEVSTRDVPERHRSVRAVFEHSWRLLSPGEQEALTKLAVFRGGFTLQAADAVAGVRLPLLLALVNKSFVRREASGRFGQHPLVHQFSQARARLKESAWQQAQERHAAHFLGFLQAREASLHTARDREVVREIEADIENIEAAWRYAAAHGPQAWLAGALTRLAWTYFARGWAQPGLALLQDTQPHVEQGSVLHGRILQWQGAMVSWHGEYQASLNLHEQSLEILERHQEEDARAALAFCLRGLGGAYHRRGYISKYLAAFGRALELYRELGDTEGITMMLHAPAYHAKDADESLQHFQEGIDLARPKGLSRPLAMTLDSVAEVYVYRKGDYLAAKRAMEECLRQFSETGELLYRLGALRLYLTILIELGEDGEARRQAQALRAVAETLHPSVAKQPNADALSTLSRLAYLQGDLPQARALAEEGCALAGVSFCRGGFDAVQLLARSALAQGDLAGAARWLDKAWGLLEPHPMYGDFERVAAKLACVNLLGELAALQGNDHEAKMRFVQALKLAQEWDYLPSALEALLGLSKLLRRGDQDQAAARLSLIADHSAAKRESKNEAKGCLRDRHLTPIRPVRESIWDVVTRFSDA